LINQAEWFQGKRFDERLLMSAMDDQVEDLTPVSAIRRESRGPVVGVIEGAPRASEPKPEPEDQTIPPDAAEEVDQDLQSRPMGRLRESGAIPILAGGISVVSRSWWKFAGGALRAGDCWPCQAARSRVAGWIG